MSKPILCLDFDGVIHGYQSGWQGADVIADPPVPRALDFIERALDHFQVAIYSSRSSHPGGIPAMKRWLRGNLGNHIAVRDGIAEAVRAITIVNDLIKWPTEKPPAFLTIDDRAITFNGEWPAMETLLAFKPWNKKDASVSCWANACAGNSTAVRSDARVFTVPIKQCACASKEAFK